jgi:ATP-dependent DNA ligase
MAVTAFLGHGLVLSEGVAGSGRTFFDKVVEQGHEGVMAKHLQSRYLPGRRVQAWRKIKPFQSVPCVVISYTPSFDGIHNLLVAATAQGVLRYSKDRRPTRQATRRMGSTVEQSQLL